MAEASFAKSFLSTLDSRPIKLSADHVEDARKLPARPPYILPRMPKPMNKPLKLAPGQERSVSVVLKSLRNPPIDIKLTSQPLESSVLEIKSKVSNQTKIPAEKIKLLHSKRPVADSKLLREVVGDKDVSVEFSVMVIGGASSITSSETDSAAQAKSSAPPALDTDAFWSDLQGFLAQRLKNQATAEELSRLFRTTWKSRQV